MIEGGFWLANCVDLYEMSCTVTFHLGLHCLPKYLFAGFPYTKDNLGFHTICTTIIENFLAAETIHSPLVFHLTSLIRSSLALLSEITSTISMVVHVSNF